MSTASTLTREPFVPRVRPVDRRQRRRQEDRAWRNEHGVR